MSEQGTDALAQSQSAGERPSSKPEDACAIVDRQFILQWFSPRWFIAIMGIGALANIYQTLSGAPTGLLHSVAVAFLLLGLVAFPVAGALKLWRFVAHFRCIAQEFTHSSLMQFYAAIPISAAILSTGLLSIPVAGVTEATRVLLAQYLWWFSLVLSLVFIVLIPTRVILGDHAEPKRALGFWFLPPVGLFVLVFNGNFLAGHLEGSAAAGIFQLNLVILGLALLLTVAMFTIFLFRALFIKFPAPDVAPSYLIGLAPIGVSIIAMNSFLPLYGQFAPAGLPPMETLAGMVGLGSLLLWGFGLWWLVVSATIIISKLMTTGIPVTLGYWAFIFPPAAYTLATLLLAGKYPFVFLEVTGQILAALVTFVWVVTTVLVAKHTWSKRIFLLPASFQDLDISGAAGTRESA